MQLTPSNRMRSAILPLIVVGLSLFAVGYSNSSNSPNQAPAAKGPAGISPDQQKKLIHQGKLLFDQTPKYARDYVGNALSCNDCHIESGTAAHVVPMTDLAGQFPMFSKRAGHVITLQNRIQECFARSEAGKPLPLDSPQMKAMVAYIDWLSRNQPRTNPYPGRGLIKLPPLMGDPTRGKTIYVAQCAECHGISGEGVPPILPALWGKNSYNDGAGMNNPAKMAAFISYAMPQSHPGALTPQQAYDVATYIHTKPRPKFNEAYKSY